MPEMMKLNENIGVLFYQKQEHRFFFRNIFMTAMNMTVSTQKMIKIISKRHLYFLNNFMGTIKMLKQSKQFYYPRKEDHYLKLFAAL